MRQKILYLLFFFTTFLQNVVQNTPEEPLIDVSHTSPRPTSPAPSDVPETPSPVSSNHHQSDAIHLTPVHNNAPNGVPSSSRRMPSDSTSLPSNPEPMPSTSKDTSCSDNIQLERSISNFEYSPFKNHLKISDSLIITRKFTRTESKVPYAISGRDYFDLAKKTQEEKEKKIQLQEERKKKRLEKQALAKSKKTQKKRKLNDRSETENEAESENEAETQVVLDDSDDDMGLDEENCCFACLGNEDWTNNRAWLGCSGTRCRKWFHKSCISDEVCDMDNEQLREFEFFCKDCQRQMRSK